MASASTAATKTSAPLTPMVLSRLKPGKIFQNAVDPPSAPTNPSAQPSQQRPNNPRHITGISIDDHGDTVITAAEDETFRLFSCKTGKHVKTLYSKKYGVDLPRFTHKASNIIYASTKEDDTIRYHSLHDNKYLQYFRGHKKTVVSLEVSPLDDGFMSGSMDNTVRLWDLRTPNCRGLLNLPAPPLVAYDCSGLVFAVGINTYQKILLYDIKNFDKEPFLTITINDTALSKISYPPRVPCMTSMSFSANGKWLLVGTAGDMHYVLDAFDGTLLAKLEGFKGLEGGKNGTYGVKSSKGISGEEVSWTSDSKFIVSGSSTGKIYFWNASEIPPPENFKEGGAEEPKVILPIITLDGHPGPSRCVRFNSRYQMMVSAGAELVSGVL
ncbi:member of Set1p complex, histone methyl transferase [Tulasnella sp. 419]|nr:member of Set1p complex, histone methyl transferase [Tulasnella sp. 419]